MVRKQIGATIASVLAVVAMQVGLALADAIDGNWCTSDGKNMSINGPQIVTPGGKKMKGDYDRHGFRYVVPKPEKSAGVQVVMRQIDDDTIYVTISKASTKV